ncbi:MAG: sugar ABC transporter permease [Gloeocapsa sp. DLM2.Bin57]|nr:MAG: sugar ABC transporter permease [Gloeocapsa sp. DLM2.Bin57]
MKKRFSPLTWLDQDNFAAWLFLTPALVLLGIFLFWPILYLIYLSFTDGNLGSQGSHWVGIQNYLKLLTDDDFRQVIGNTLYFTIATVIPSIIIPLILAVLLNQSLPTRGLLRTAYFLPSVTSLVAVGLGFRWLFQTDGPVNSLLEFFGIKAIPWLSSGVWAMLVLILLSIWKQLGFNLVVFLAGLQTIPGSLYEAAELDGANPWAKFWYVTLPGLKPTLIFVVVTTVIFTLRSFEQVYVITGGGPVNSTNILAFYVYQEAFARFQFGYAATGATLLLLVTLFFVYLQLKTWSEED